jgi:malonate-semialdehyde dehydrogenase (acetylating)/methylmalonate-semialdehyde dehydrogenase
VPKTATTTKVCNPSTGEVIAETPMCGADIVDKAVQSCAAAALDWAEMPPVERARILFRYKMLLEDHFEELAKLVTREHGKTITRRAATCGAAWRWSSTPAGRPSC